MLCYRHTGKIMGTKNATVRLPEDMVKWLTSSGNSINQGIINSVDTLKTIQTISMNELKGVFSPNEWRFLADCMNGIMITDSLRFSKDILISHCEDAELYEKKASKWNVDLDSLKKKITVLHGANIDAIYLKLDKLYYSDFTQSEEIEAWAVF